MLLKWVYLNNIANSYIHVINIQIKRGHEIGCMTLSHTLDDK